MKEPSRRVGYDGLETNMAAQKLDPPRVTRNNTANTLPSAHYDFSLERAKSRDCRRDPPQGNKMNFPHNANPKINTGSLSVGVPER